VINHYRVFAGENQARDKIVTLSGHSYDFVSWWYLSLTPKE